MPLYFYQAIKRSGEKVTGVLEAKDKLELAKLLHEKGLILISANLEEPKKTISLPDYLSGLFNIPLSDKLLFTKNLKVMIASGVPLQKALRTLALQVKHPKFRRIINKIEEEITKGTSLSTALAKYPKVFPRLYVSIVRVGEESGTLEKSFESLAFQMEREHEIKSQIKSALIYPAVVISTMILVGIGMLTFVVPELSKIFKEFKVELPPTTKFVLSLGENLKENLLLILLGFLVLIVGIKILTSTPTGRKIKDKLLLSLPVIGELVKKMNLSYISRTLATLLATGVSFGNSLEITSQVATNAFYQDALKEAKAEIEKGQRLSVVLEKYPHLFDPTTLQMLAVGEETGETSKILEDLASFYENQVNTATKNLVSLIEPLLMLIIGAVIGFFAVSMIQPIYSMLGSLQ